MKAIFQGIAVTNTTIQIKKEHSLKFANGTIKWQMGNGKINFAF